MSSRNMHPRNIIFLCLSTAVLTLGQFPGKVSMAAELNPSPETNLESPTLISPLLISPEEIPSLPSLGAATDYLPIDPPPTVATELIRLELRLGERRVYVFKNDQIVASYQVAIGRAGWETPTGNFAVRAMIENPGWENFITGEVIPPGDDNPLGVRWISFWTDGSNEIGFHGTPDEELIGQAVSHGCVRMRNRDVMALFSKVTVGTPVIVKP